MFAHGLAMLHLDAWRLIVCDTLLRSFFSFLVQVTKHDDVFMLDGEGMPTVGNPFVKGRLFVIFKVSAVHFFFFLPT